MPKAYTYRISMIRKDLESSNKDFVQDALNSLYGLLQENIALEETLDQDLSDEVFAIAKDHPNLRPEIVTKLQKFSDLSDEIEHLINLIGEIPTPPVSEVSIHPAPTTPNIDSFINWITSITFSLSGLLGGVSVWFSSKEGLLAAIFLMTLVLIVYFAYIIFKKAGGARS